MRDFLPNLAVLQRIRTSGLAATHCVMLNWARALLGRTTHPLCLTDASFD